VGVAFTCVAPEPEKRKSELWGERLKQEIYESPAFFWIRDKNAL
jgi:hypothetical protein